MLKEIIQYPLKIKGASAHEFVEVKSPYTGEPIASVAQADEKAIDAALSVARQTFTDTMQKMPAHKRSKILAKTSALIEENLEDLARTISMEGGKAIKDARMEVIRASSTFAIAAEEALRINGEQFPMDRNPGHEGKLGFVLRQPIGVIGAITPFNFPLNLVAHKLAPALACGNTVVLKPASQTPISAFKLAEILDEAGLPEGALTIVPCRGSKANALVRDSRLAMLTFTGSGEVGWRLPKEVHAGTRVILELGGNAAMVIHDDADIKAAAQAATRGGFAQAGQSCISIQRIYVQENVYDKFMGEYVELVKGLKLGDPLDDNTDVGPVIDDKAHEKTLHFVDEAVKKGAKIECGGKSHPHNLVEPTVLSSCTHDMIAVCEEVFGPLVTVMKYATMDEAIEKVNDSRYGLQAAVFTKDLEIAFKAARAFDAGGVIVNDAPNFRADHMPYGGRKESGLGLEGVRYAMQEMTQPKFVCLNLPKL